MLLMKPYEQFRGTHPEQCRPYHVRKPVRIISHAPKAIEECQRVNWNRNVPCVVVILADAAGQAEQRRHVPRHERLTAAKEGGVAAALRRAQSTKGGLDSEVQQSRDSGAHAC